LYNKNPAYYSQSIFICFIGFSERAVVISLNNFKGFNCVIVIVLFSIVIVGWRGGKTSGSEEGIDEMWSKEELSRTSLHSVTKCLNSGF
jgi:hypothetical protein